MWRPDIEVVEKFKKNWIGGRGTAQMMITVHGGDEMPNVIDGQPTKIPPRLDLHSHYSFFPALLFPSSYIIIVFLRFHSHPVLYNNIIPGIRRSECALPDPLSHQFRFTNSAFIASPFVYPHLSSHYQ